MPYRRAWFTMLPDAGLFALRVFAGLALALAHGTGKLPPSDAFVAGVGEMGFPAPHVFAWAAGLSESVGGMLLAVGLVARPAAGFILATMLVAAFVKQAGDPFLERELAMLYAAVALMFLAAGPGRYSLDGLIARHRASRGPVSLVVLDDARRARGTRAPRPARTLSSNRRPGG